MTISVDTNKQTYTGDDSTTVFNSVFKIFDDDDIRVEVVTDSTSSVATQVKNTDYTVSTITAPSSAVNITFTTAPASGTTVVLRRNQSRIQSTDLVENDNLPAQTLENDTDKVVMMIQELKEEIDRCIKLDPSQTLSTYVAALSGNTGKALAVNSAEDGFDLTSISELSLDIDGLTVDTAIDTADTLAFYDDSASTHKKITYGNLIAAVDHDALTNFVADEHINWTSTNRNFTTTGTAATGALSVTGAITVTSTVDGRDIATDGTKLDGIEALADVTDEANVTAALDGATLTAVTVAGTDKVLVQDADDSDNLKTVTAQSIADLSTSGIDNVVEDTTPQLGGNLDVNGNKIVSTSNGNIDIEPNGTGNVLLGNMTFDADQTIGAGQDNYVLTYDDAGGIISLEAAAGGGLGNIVEDTTPQLGGQLDVNGNAIGDGTNELLTFTEDASAVNHVNIENEATGSGPIIRAAGDDANIDLNIQPKATGNVTVSDGTDTTKKVSFEVSGATTAKTATITSSHTDNRTITLPDATDTLVGKATTDTFTNKTFDANGTGNSLSNVDVADLANGTDGELITWDAAGAPTTVAVGTSGHVLTSNGVGAAPTFQAAGGGAWSLIATGTASSSSSIDFTDLSSTYYAYAVVLSDVLPATDSVALAIRTSTDNGSSYDSGASDYHYTSSGKSSNTTTINSEQSTGATSMIMTGQGGGWDQGNVANSEVANGVVYIYNPSSTAHTHVSWTISHGSPAANFQIFTGGGRRSSAADVDAIRFLYSSGNIASGTFKLYGITAA